MESQQLAHSLEQIILSWGVHSTVARAVATNMAQAHACGHASHGVQLLPRYHRWLTQLKILNTQPQLTFDRTPDPSSVSVDAHRSFGHWALPEILRQAAASSSDVVQFSARRLGHTGYVAQCLRDAQLQDRVLILWINTSGSRLVRPWQAQGKWMSSTVMAAAMPGGWVMDMGLAATAENSVHHRLHSGQQLAPGQVALECGASTTDPGALYRVTAQGLNAAQSTAAILFGDHRWFAQALLAESLAGVLTGSGTGQSSSFFQGAWGILVRVSPEQQQRLAQYAQWIQQTGARLPGTQHDGHIQLLSWEQALLDQWLHSPQGCA